MISVIKNNLQQNNIPALRKGKGRSRI